MVNTQTVVAAFTEMASDYEQIVDRELRQFWGVGYHQFIKQLLSQMDLSQAKLVLDVATGRGVIPLALTERRTWHGRVVGVDITPEMLGGAREQVASTGLGDRVSLVGGSGMRLPFATSVFDAVVCALATHHMDLDTLLAELHRVLRPGGQLLIAEVALAEFWHSRGGRIWLKALLTGYGWRVGRARMRAELDALQNMRTPEDWRDLVLTSGFRMLELTTLAARRRWYPPGILIRAYSSAPAGA